MEFFQPVPNPRSLTLELEQSTCNVEDRVSFIRPLDTVVAVANTIGGGSSDVLVQQLRNDEAIAAADTLFPTIPNQLSVDYNAHVIEAILTHVAPALGWR
ncbi:MAG TPA: hypothetical protein VIJ16_08460 [Gemmatimonadaceae bacterium]